MSAMMPNWDWLMSLRSADCSVVIGILYINTVSNWSKKGTEKLRSFSRTTDEYTEVCEKPVVIHFADKEKPWNNPSVLWVEKWFEYCLSPDVWAVLDGDERSVLINSIRACSGMYKKEKFGVIATFVSSALSMR